MANKEVNLTLKVDAEAAIKATKTQTNQMSKLEKAQKAYVDTLSKEGQEIRNVNKSKAQLKKQQDLEAQAANAAAGSYDQLSAQYRLNVIQLNAMSDAERKTTASGKKLTEETLNLRTAMADAKKETGDNTLNVGNYKDDIISAGKESGIFASQIALISKAQRISNMVMGQGTKALKVMRLAIISSGVGALALAILAVGRAFTDSEKGQNKFNKIMKVIGVVLGNIMDKVADFGEMIIEAFENPKKTLESLKESIKTNIQNRIEGLLELLPALGKAISLAFKGDFSEAATVAGDAVAKVGLGVEDFSKKAKTAFNSATSAVSTFITETEKEMGMAARASDLSAKTDKLERAQLVKRAKLEAEVADLRLKARQEEDYTAAQRLEFMKQAGSVQEELLATDLIIAKNRAEIITMENTFSRSNKENLDAEAAAKAEVSKVESARLNVARQIQRELNKLNKEAARDAEAEIKKQEARDKEDLERLAAFEQAKKQLKEDLALEAAETEEERELLKAEQDAEKKALEFENMILEAEERTELEALLLEQKENTLQEIRDKYIKINEKKQKDASKGRA